MTRLYSWLFYSIAIHMVLSVLIYSVPPLSMSQNDMTEVEFIDHSFKDFSKNVVRKAEVPEHLKTFNKQKTSYKSDVDQSVLQETRAEKTGLTKNNFMTVSKNSWLHQEQQKLEQKTQKPAERSKNLNGYTAVPVETIREASQYSKYTQESTVGEDLPKDISIGSFTALNTDKFTYYSFYSRVEELIRGRWENNIQNSISSFDRNYLMSVVKNKNWVTQVEFWLYPNGKFHSAHIMKESGIKNFDMSAVQAFREANLFPNPPTELIDGDGFIHLRYSFNVHWNPSIVL